MSVQVVLNFLSDSDIPPINVFVTWYARAVNLSALPPRQRRSQETLPVVIHRTQDAYSKRNIKFSFL